MILPRKLKIYHFWWWQKHIQIFWLYNNNVFYQHPKRVVQMQMTYKTNLVIQFPIKNLSCPFNTFQFHERKFSSFFANSLLQLYINISIVHFQQKSNLYQAHHKENLFFYDYAWSDINLIHAENRQRKFL